MKTKYLLLLTLFLTCAGYAQRTESFDIATYKIPTAFKKSLKEGMVSYSNTNDSKGIYCIINVYANINSAGTVTEEFDKQWQSLVAVAFGIKEAPEKDTAIDEEGREVISGAGGFIRDGVTGIAMLTAYVGFGKTTCVLSLTNDKSYYKQIEEFLGGFNLKKSIAPRPVVTVAKTTQSKTSIANAASESTFHSSNNLEGVWMAMHIKTFYHDNAKSGDIKWITFFNNGRVAKVIPDEGMNNFDKNDKDIGYYHIANNKATLQWFANTTPFDIKFLSPDKIQFQEVYGNDTYYRCKILNAVRIDGSWTSFNNINDPDLDNNSITRSLITFKKDGSFIDYGVFADAYSNPVPPGNGSYDINDFTLTLKYSNGKTKQTCISGFLNLDLNNSNLIYINRLAFHKRNNIWNEKFIVFVLNA